MPTCAAGRGNGRAAGKPRRAKDFDRLRVIKCTHSPDTGMQNCMSIWESPLSRETQQVLLQTSSIVDPLMRAKLTYSMLRQLVEERGPPHLQSGGVAPRAQSGACCGKRWSSFCGGTAPLCPRPLSARSSIACAPASLPANASPARRSRPQSAPSGGRQRLASGVAGGRDGLPKWSARGRPEPEAEAGQRSARGMPDGGGTSPTSHNPLSARGSITCATALLPASALPTRRSRPQSAPSGGRQRHASEGRQQPWSTPPSSSRPIGTSTASGKQWLPHWIDPADWADITAMQRRSPTTVQAGRREWVGKPPCYGSFQAPWTQGGSKLDSKVGFFGTAATGGMF